MGIPGDGSSVPWGHVERRAPEAHTGSHSQTLGGPRELAAVLSRRSPLARPCFPGSSNGWARLPTYSQSLHQSPAGPLGTLCCSRNVGIRYPCAGGISHTDHSTENARILTHMQPPSPSGQSGPSHAPPLTVQTTLGQAPDTHPRRQVTLRCPPTITPSGKCTGNVRISSHFPDRLTDGFGVVSSHPDPHRTHTALRAASPKLPVHQEAPPWN